MGSSKENSHYETQLSALGQFLQTLHQGETDAALVESTLNYLTTESQAPLIWIGLYAPKEHQIQGVAGRLPSADLQTLKQRFQLAPGDLLEQVIVNQSPIRVVDLAAEVSAGELRKMAQRQKIQGCAILPIRHRDRCLGVVILGWLQWGVAPRSEETLQLSIALKELGAALEQLHKAQKQQQAKRPDESLFPLLDKLRSLPTLDLRLDALVTEMHRFLVPARTCIYFFEASQRTFELKASFTTKGLGASENRQGATAAAIPAREMGGLYQELVKDQTLILDDSPVSFKNDVAHRLFLRGKIKSALIVPIVYQQELKGFLLLEQEQTNAWEEPQIQYVRSMAHLAALVAPLGEMQLAIQQAKTDQSLVTNLVHAIVNEQDWQETLKTFATAFCKHLQADRLLILFYNREQNQFEILHQFSSHNRSVLTGALPSIEALDWELLERSPSAVKIENWAENFKFLSWREALAPVGIQSVLLCNTRLQHPLEGVLLIGQESPRAWTHAEQDIVQVTSQQLGLVLRQWSLQRQHEQQQATTQALQWGLTTLQQIQQIETLQTSAVEMIAQTIQAPLAALITWTPGADVGTLSTVFSRQETWHLTPGIEIPLHQDALIQDILRQDGLVSITRDRLSSSTLTWLTLPDMSQVLAIKLCTTPEQESTGILIVADQANRRWSERYLSVMGTLVSQLAWFRRYLLLTRRLQTQSQALQHLNWYKTQRLEEFRQIITTSLKWIVDQETLTAHQGISPELARSLSQRRYQEALQQLRNLQETITTLNQAEAWQIQPQQDTLLLATLIKRSLERVDGLLQERRLWSQVHNLPEGSPNTLGNLQIRGDTRKIELVLRDLIAAACQRVAIKGRIDIWPRLLDTNWLELSITDNGKMDASLIEDLTAGRASDLLLPSPLDQPPGLNLQICRFFVHQVKGDLTFYQLEDGRVLTRLVLPVEESPRS
jgi:transcriptional regulator with GAF, ATPase, and Fis domain